MFIRLSISILYTLSIFLFAASAYSQSADYGRPAGFLRMEVQPNDEKLASTPFDPFDKTLNSQIFGLTGGMSEDSGDQIKLWEEFRGHTLVIDSAEKVGNQSSVKS